MNAFKCDGCGEFQNGDPLFTISTEIAVFAEQEAWHCCTWACIQDLADRKREEHASRERHPSNEPSRRPTSLFGPGRRLDD